MIEGFIEDCAATIEGKLSAAYTHHGADPATDRTLLAIGNIETFVAKQDSSCGRVLASSFAPTKSP